MEIRTATKSDLSRIMKLGKEFGHLMLYQKDPMMMEQYLDRILVAVDSTIDICKICKMHIDPPNCPHRDTDRCPNRGKDIVGYYHYIVSGDPGFEEMLRCYRQFPEHLISETRGFRGLRPPGVAKKLCICMQGASHREVFQEFILHLQVRHSDIWNYCSIKSRRTDTYKELGFTYNPEEQYTFFNVSKGGISTYQLGRWTESD